MYITRCVIRDDGPCPLSIVQGVQQFKGGVSFFAQHHHALVWTAWYFKWRYANEQWRDRDFVVHVGEIE